MRVSRQRIAKIRAKFGEKYVGFRQTDGTVKHIRRDSVLSVGRDALNGLDTPATRAMLCAESATDSSKLHQALQALHRPAYVPARPLVKVIQ